MHTLEDVLGQGVGREIVEAVLGAAHERGYERLSLETATSEAFAPVSYTHLTLPTS